MINNYWKWLENERKNIVPTSDGNKFKVVIVRFEEDLHWVNKEFGSDIQVIVYNKGPDNLDYLSSNCKIVKTPNVGWFGGTVLLYIAENYDQLSNKTLFVQGQPYDQGVYLPMLRYAGDIDSVCTNIIAKCEPTTLIEQSNKLQYYTPEQWAASKYHKFKPLNYTMVDFFHKYIDPKFPLAKTFMMDIGSQFAINIDKIKSHPKEFYTSLLPLFNETYATEDFCFEKGIDPLFGADVFNYDLKHIKKLDLTKTFLDKLLFENVALNKIEAVKNLIDAGANVNSLHTKDNITALLTATQNNLVSMVELLIESGADVNKGDPINWSLMKEYLEITNLLLKAGAEVRQNNNYDMAYVINLDIATDRWEKMSFQLDSSNIKYKRFKAVEGKDILLKNAANNLTFYGTELMSKSLNSSTNDLHQISCNPKNTNPVMFNYSGQLLKKPGELGLWCSNIMIWQDALRNNYKNIIIFEDDIKIKSKNVNQEINHFIEYLPKTYDLGYLDLKPRNGSMYSLPGNKYVNGFDENFFSWGTHAVAFSKKAMKRLLSFSVYTGAIDIFYWLYSKNKNPNNINNPLLLETYSSSNLNLIEAETGYSFINEGEVNIDFKSQYHDSANEELIKAIASKDPNKIKTLLGNGANPHHIAKDGNSMLQLAAILGYTDVVDLFLKEAVDPDWKHKNGATALIMSVIKGHIKVTKLLLNAGADRNVTLQNLSLEKIALMQNHTELAKIIKEHNVADKSYMNILFIHAALKNNIVMVNKYLEAGADIDNVVQGNVTSLLIATSNGNIDLVKNLVERGANVNIHNPLFASAKHGHSEITKFLIDSGANIEALSNNNDNPMFATVHNGHYQDVKYLLDAGSSIQSDRLHTPLFEAAYYNGRSPERSAIYNLLINHYWKWLEQELKTMPEIESKETFEAVLVRYKEDLHWTMKEYSFDTNVTIYNKGPNDIDYLPSNYKIVNIPNVGWFGGTILYHIVTNYDQLADITFFGQGLIYDQELYLPAIRYKGYINSTCKNIVAKCDETTLLEQSNKLANYTKEQWATSKYNKFVPLNYTMIDYFNKNICPDFPLNESFKLDLGAQFAVKSSQIRLNSKEYYASKLQDFNETYPYADFCLEKAWDVIFDPEYAQCYRTHVELSGDVSII